MLDEFRVDAGVYLGDAIEVIKEQQAEITGLIRERDEAHDQFMKLSRELTDAIKAIGDYERLTS